MTQLILTLSTALFFILSVACVAIMGSQLRTFRTYVSHAKKQLNSVTDIGMRLDNLERGQEMMTERHHAQIGRHGALVARVNKLERQSPGDIEPDVDPSENEAARERQALYRKLAEHNGGRS